MEQSPLARKRVNQLAPQNVGCATSLSSWIANVSSARLYMFAGHLGQMVPIAKPSIRRNLTGTEREYGKYVFNHQFEEDVRIIDVIQKYGKFAGDSQSIMHSPSTTVVYENAYSREIGMMELTDYIKKHQSFGYMLRDTPLTNRVVPKATFNKGDIIKQSPNVDSFGNWAYGIEVPMCFMSVPQIIEDGVVGCDSLVEAMAYDQIIEAVAGAGGKWILLNLYGDENNYKPCPDPGEKIKEHGVIMALRRWDPNLVPVLFTPKALMQIDYGFDKPIYGEPGATVLDVDVWWNGEHRNAQERLPVGTTDQLFKYHNKAVQNAKQLLETIDRLYSERREDLVLSKELTRKVAEAYARVKAPVNRGGKIHKYPNSSKFLGQQKLSYIYKRSTLDDWRISVKYIYRSVPNVGSKMTGCHGNKGVFVEIKRDHEMPLDEWGRRAWMIQDGDSAVKRMNPACTYEPYVDSAKWHCHRQLVALAAAGKYDEAFEYVMGFYKTGFPEHYQYTLDYLSSLPEAKRAEAKAYHLQSILSHTDPQMHGLYTLLPSNSEVIGAEQIRRLKNSIYRPPRGPVTYTDTTDRVVTTKRPVRVGAAYILLLEKTGDDWSSVSSPKLQHFGIPAKLSRADKLFTAGKETPVRFLGEDEVRLILNFANPELAYELLDQTNSPLVHKNAVRHLLTADKPTAITGSIVDRAVAPRGMNRATTFVKHLISCGGIKVITDRRGNGNAAI